MNALLNGIIVDDKQLRAWELGIEPGPRRGVHWADMVSIGQLGEEMLPPLEEEDDGIDLIVPGTTPGPVGVHVDAWNVDTQPATYRVQLGDTFVGLSKTYLGDGGRWREIWNMNKDKAPDPNMLGPVTLRMPNEARDNLLAWIDEGEPTDIVPGEVLPPEGSPRSKGMSTVAKVAAAGAALALVGGVVYLATK